MPAVIVQPAGLRALAVAELDAFGLDAQHTVARAGPAGRHRPRRLRGAVPDQVLGADAGLVTGRAVAVDGGRAQGQRGQAVFARERVARIQRDRAVEIHGLARRQRQPLQRRGAGAGVATQQTAQDVLVQPRRRCPR
ncbi:hypothetical protein G6F32_015487 [Rhizopus arrhizus]|nr:hypothetical protein G6F32_015487 [Rhizopus arrhizus]